jgi:hypothetical protein
MPDSELPEQADYEMAPLQSGPGWAESEGEGEEAEIEAGRPGAFGRQYTDRERKLMGSVSRKVHQLGRARMLNQEQYRTIRAYKAEGYRLQRANRLQARRIVDLTAALSRQDAQLAAGGITADPRNAPPPPIDFTTDSEPDSGPEPEREPRAQAGLELPAGEEGAGSDPDGAHDNSGGPTSPTSPTNTTTATDDEAGSDEADPEPESGEERVARKRKEATERAKRVRFEAERELTEEGIL